MGSFFTNKPLVTLKAGVIGVYPQRVESERYIKKKGKTEHRHTFRRKKPLEKGEATYSDQIRSVAQSCPTLCDPMNRSTPGLPVHHQLPEFTQTHVH